MLTGIDCFPYVYCGFITIAVLTELLKSVQIGEVSYLLNLQVFFIDLLKICRTELCM